MTIRLIDKLRVRYSRDWLAVTACEIIAAVIREITSPRPNMKDLSID